MTKQRISDPEKLAEARRLIEDAAEKRAELLGPPAGSEVGKTTPPGEAGPRDAASR
jgi:hypothetical protein